VCITVMVNHKFISFSTVQICDLSYIHLHKPDTLCAGDIEFFFVSRNESLFKQIEIILEKRTCQHKYVL